MSHSHPFNKWVSVCLDFTVVKFKLSSLKNKNKKKIMKNNFGCDLWFYTWKSNKKNRNSVACVVLGWCE